MNKEKRVRRDPEGVQRRQGADGLKRLIIFAVELLRQVKEGYAVIDWR